MKQTAIEYLIENAEDFLGGLIAPSIIEQAKAIEKEQAFEFWQGGINWTEKGGKSFEQYYNETFK